MLPMTMLYRRNIGGRKFVYSATNNINSAAVRTECTAVRTAVIINYFHNSFTLYVFFFSHCYFPFLL